MMIINKRFATAALALTLAFSLSACSNMHFHIANAKEKSL